MFSSIIKAKELGKLMQSKTPVYLLDTTYGLPNAKEEHFKLRIPGAKFFELDEVADKESPFAHDLPSTPTFVDYMKQLRIKNDGNLLVCYDQTGLMAAPRVWYTFKVFGRQNVAVLDGGLPKWLEENLPTESGKYELYQNPSSEKDQDYQYQLDPNGVVYIQEIDKIVSKKPTGTQMLDARPESQFSGEQSQATGHIPGAINSFFRNILNEDSTFKSAEEIKSVLESKGVSLEKSNRIVHSCRSGVTACINLLGTEIAGHTNNALYDGSWTEYGSKKYGGK